MATQKQIDANRRNAAHSSGPRTSEGKSASCMNALKSGIHANSQIIRGEDAADLETLSTEYHDRYHPTTPEERMLIDTLIDCEWLLRRFRTVEAQLWSANETCLDASDAGKELGYIFSRGAEAMLRLQRRIDSTQRNYRRALKDLEDLRRCRPEAPQPEPEPEPIPATPCKQEPTPTNGFVPQFTPCDPETPAESPANPLEPSPLAPCK